MPAVEKCAPQAIQLKTNGYPHIDLTKCIHCYCCSEYCPKKAITLSGGLTNHLIRGLRQVMKL
jgi:formate hydrogenlyase subunit 6/NADH:ubiquinone oxidoreductase subunit I